MKASVLTDYRHLDWQDVPDPTLTASQVLVKVNYAGICGSDMHIFHGDFHPRTTLPLIMGHEFAGTIVDLGSEVKAYKVGDRVAVDPIAWCGQCPACRVGHYPACSSLALLGIDSDGGFAQYVAAESFMLFPLPDTVSDRHAALIEVLSIGFHACARAGVKSGDSLIIFGAGRVGQCILQAAATLTDNSIYMVDILESRLKLAADAYDQVVPIDARQYHPAHAITEFTKGQGVDVAIEAVGHAQAIEGQTPPVAQCVDTIRGAGTVCVLGLGDDPVPLLMKTLIWKEARLVTSRVTHGEFALTIDHLSEGHLKPDMLISATLKASQAQHAFDLVDQCPEQYLKVLLEIEH
ncbi:MAG: alcohol dehydrogenase catalytic domain-containing protein [Phycisphaerae bacterium]|nr:alcohol dehydrogenase catalytic domain-containing protein [Phycisphaerae bacterium]